MFEAPLEDLVRAFVHLDRMGRKCRREACTDMSSDLIGSLPEDTLRVLRASTGTSLLSSPLIVAGKSGTRHSFTLGMKGPVSVLLACDVLIGLAPIDETKVLSLFIKVYDVNANRVILCAVPSLTLEAKRLAALYKMTVCEALEKEQAFARLSEILRELPKER